MMQRAAGGSITPEVCTTPENQLSCSLGLDTCPTQCQNNNNTAKAGTLDVTTTAPSYTSIPAMGAVKHATVSFKAGSDDVKLYSVEMKKTGLATLNGTKMYFEKNGARITSKASFSEDKATLSFTTALTVKAGATETVDLYVYASGTAGDEYQFVSTKIDSSAATVNGTITTPLLRAANYSVLALTMTTSTSALSYKVDSSKLVELGQFTLGTFTGQDSKDMTFKAITLNQKGNADLATTLTDLGLYRDDVLVSTKATVNGRDVSFVLNDTIKHTKSSVLYVVKGKIANAERLSDNYNFQIKYPENTDITETTTSFKVGVANTTSLPFANVTLLGADLKFNQPATSYTKQVVPGAKEVVFYTGTIQSLTTATLENLVITGNTTVSGLNDIVRTFYVRIGNTVLSATPGNSVTEAISFDGTVTINGTVPFVVYADIKDTAPATTIKFLGSVNLAAFVGTKEYGNGDVITSSIGSLSPITINVTAASLQLSNTITSTKNVQRGDNTLTLANLELSTTTDVVSKLYSFKATPAGTSGANFQRGTVTVYDADGNALVSDNITSTLTDLTFVMPTPLAISKGHPLALTVKLDRVANAVNSGDTMQLTFKTFNAKEIITSNNVTPTPSTITSATLKTVSAGTVNVIAQTFNASLVKLNGAVTSIGTLKFRPYNGDAKLKTVQISIPAGLTPLSRIALLDSGTEIAVFVKSGTALYADNINKDLLADTTKTFDVVATLLNASTAADLGSATTLSLIQADFESMNGTPITASTLPATVSSAMTFVKAKPTIALVGVSGAGTAKAVYKFSVKAEGGDINVNTLKVDFANNTDTVSTGMTGTLYFGEEGSTILGAVAPTASTDTLSFTSLGATAIVSNGETKLFTLVIPVTNWYKNTVNGNINLEVSNITYTDTFSDTTTATHTNMFPTYKWDIAPVTTLASLHQ